MKKLIFFVLSVVVLVVLGSLPVFAHDSRAYFRGGVWIGPGWGPQVYSYYPYYVTPQVIIREQPPVYFQPAPQQEEQQQYYWYYCQNPQGYYPYVKQCPGGWMKVVPSPASSGREE